VEGVLVGQKALLDGLLIGLLADGHVLLEGVPGLAKSLAVQSLARAIGASSRRIQFTPDLLPAGPDRHAGLRPAAPGTGRSEGPVFANIVLADEINRAPAKVQSALLEAMQERQVRSRRDLPAPEPFLVLATQNPVEQEGTYPLPEAQVDRFMLKLVVGYPSKDEEHRSSSAWRAAPPEIGRWLRPSRSSRRGACSAMSTSTRRSRRYVVDLVFATRDPGPRGSRSWPG
jgi:MoxR-like ATPase